MVGRSCMCVRKRLVELVERDVSVSEASRLCGLSRKTAYKWIRRSEQEGKRGLLDRSRAPHHIERFEGDAAEWLLDLRRKFPRWGPKKLLQYAERHRPSDAWPARSTVAALLQRRGLITAKPTRAEQRIPFRYAGPTPTEPNARWTMDFKGDFRLKDGTWTKPFTLRDAASRMVLDLCVTSTTRSEFVQSRLERAFRAFGMPDEIQSDTGSPFASVGLAQLTSLSVWLLRHDVEPVLSRPGKPQDNGAHERMHRDYKAEATRPPAANARAQQRRSTSWMRHFNEERPHDALGGDVPREHWSPSKKRYEPTLSAAEYPSWWSTRRVDSDGNIYWHDQKISCSRALRRETIGLEPVDDGVWRVHLARFPIALFDETARPRFFNLPSG